MGKFDFSSTIASVQESLKKNKKNTSLVGLGSSIVSISPNKEDYVVMPDWWQESFGVPGLQFGKIVQIAGDSDSGKTSLALEAILAAQQQGHGVIYVETENKTGEADLILKGIDPKGVMVVSSSITEEAFDSAFRLWDGFFMNYPKDKLLLVYDSFGNTVSLHDTGMDLTQDSQKPGGSAKTNRLGINSLVARMHRDPVAILVVNYTYDNIGSVGKTNAGGKALNFFAALTLQSSRIGWIDAQRNNKKVRLGAKVRWRTYKNHYAKAYVDEKGNLIPLPSAIDLSITEDGLKLL